MTEETKDLYQSHLTTFFVLCLISWLTVGCAGRGLKPPGEASGGDSVEGRKGYYVSEGLETPALTDESVKSAMARVPRHEFIPESHREYAYENTALPIEEGQTISQPFIVALMTQEAGIVQGSRVLEIGTGSGYQAAVLSELGASVYSIEIIPELAVSADERLKRLGYDNIQVKAGDGWFGWPEAAPFDAILVTAAVPRVPATLVSQLANRGRLVLPLEKGGSETLLVVERDGENIKTRDIGAVRFVPLTGAAREDENEEKTVDELPDSEGQFLEDLKSGLDDGGTVSKTRSEQKKKTS